MPTEFFFELSISLLKLLLCLLIKTIFFFKFLSIFKIVFFKVLVCLFQYLSVIFY